MIINNRQVYDSIFTIDEYRQIYLKCRLRNAFVQKHPDISKDKKKAFDRKSKRLKIMLSKICRKDFEEIDEYLTLTHACSIVHGELMTMMLKMKKIPALKKSSEFKKLINTSDSALEILNGKNAILLFIFRHPFFSLISIAMLFIATMSPLSLYLDPNIRFVYLLFICLIAAALLIFIIVRQDFLILLAHATKAKQYKYLDQGAYNEFKKLAKDVAEHIHFK